MYDRKMAQEDIASKSPWSRQTCTLHLPCASKSANYVHQNYLRRQRWIFHKQLAAVVFDDVSLDNATLKP